MIMNSVIYEMIIFDWDGTAVMDHHSPIGPLKSALEDLLKERLSSVPKLHIKCRLAIVLFLKNKTR